MLRASSSATSWRHRFADRRCVSCRTRAKVPTRFRWRRRRHQPGPATAQRRGRRHSGQDHASTRMRSVATRRRGRVRSRRRCGSRAERAPLREPRDHPAHRRPRARPTRRWRTRLHRIRSCTGTPRSPRGQSQKLPPSSSQTGNDRGTSPSNRRAHGEAAAADERRPGPGRRRPLRRLPLPTNREETRPSIPLRTLRPRTRPAAKFRPRGRDPVRASGRARPAYCHTDPGMYFPSCAWKKIQTQRKLRPHTERLGERRARSGPPQPSPPSASTNAPTSATQLTRPSSMWLPCQSERARRARR